MSDEARTTPFPFVTDITFQRGDVVFAADRRGRLVYWNKEAEEILGRTAAEVIGNPFEIVCPVVSGNAEMDLPAILSGSDFAGGLRCLDKSGKEVALYVYATAGRNQSGVAAGVVFVARDVTQFWDAEQAVRTAQDKYRLLFEHSSEAVTIADVEGRVLEANPACTRMFGYGAEELKRMRLADIVASECRADADEAMAGLARAGAVRLTTKLVKKDGGVVHGEISAFTVTVGGARRVFSVARDVTERFRAEQATHESERKYRLVFESASDAVLIETVDGRILEANKNACDLFGYTKKELLKLKVSDLVPVEARPWLPRVTDAILQDRTFRAEAVNVHKSGRHIPVEISASTMELDDRTLVLAIVRDISERKRAEAALAESENRYRALFNDSLMGIYRTSPDGEIQLANPALVRMLGYDSFAQLAERNLETDGSGPEYSRDEFKRRLERDGRIVGLEVSWQTRDGRMLFVRENARAVRGQDGAVLYYEGTVEDITERKAAEQALRQSEEKFRVLAEQSPNMIFINRRGRVVFANRKCVEAMGYATDEFCAPDFDFMKLIAPESVDTIRSVYARHERGEEVDAYEYGLVTKTGRRIDVIITTKLMDYEGGKAILGIVTDITERKAAEQALRKEKELAHSYLEVAGVIMVVLDRSGAIQLINRKGCEVLGCADGEIVGRDWFDSFVPERLRAEVRRVFQGMMRGELEPVEYYENPVVTTRGEERMVAWHNALLRDDSGRVVGTLSSGADITERRELARTAAEASAQSQAILANSPDGVAAECDGVIAYANQRFADLYGYDNPAQVTGRPTAGFVAPEDQERIAGVSEARARGDKAPTRYRFKGLRRDRTLVEVEITVSVYSLFGKQYFLGFLREAASRPRRRPADRD